MMQSQYEPSGFQKAKQQLARYEHGELGERLQTAAVYGALFAGLGFAMSAVGRSAGIRWLAYPGQTFSYGVTGGLLGYVAERSSQHTAKLASSVHEVELKGALNERNEKQKS